MSTDSIPDAGGQAKRRTLVNFLSLTLLQLGNYVLPMITLPIVSRIIGPTCYGIINYSFAFVGYFVLLINAGFDLYGSRLILQHRDDRSACSRVLSQVLGAKAVLLLAATVLFAIAVNRMPQLQADRTVAWFTFGLCAGWVLNPSWLYHGLQDSRKYAVFSFLSKLLFSILVVWVVRERSDYLYHPLITSGAHLLVSALSLAYALRRNGLRLCWPGWRAIATTLSGNRRSALIWWFTNQAQSSNIVIAGIFLSTLSIGYFSAALRLVAILQSMIAMPLNMVLFPYVGEAFLRDRESGIRRMRQSLPYVVLVSGGVSLAVLLLAGPVILGFYGSAFASAAPLLRSLAIVLFLNTVNNAFGQQVLINLGKERWYLRFVLAGAAFNVLFLPLFVGIWGLQGAALAWPVAEGLVFAGYLLVFHRQSIRIGSLAEYHPQRLALQLIEVLRVKSVKANP